MVIFSSGHRKGKGSEEFSPHIGLETIDIVDNYKYLGAMFSNNGSFKLAKNYLEKKAKRALFGMHSYINDCTLPVHTCVDLFGKSIQPITLYGSEVWAPFCLNLSNALSTRDTLFSKFTDFPGFLAQIKFDKRLLKVHDKAVNLAVLG